MFENQTYEVILERMLANISDEIDKREGSVAFDMLAPKAAELAQAYMELDNVLSFGFASTSYGEFLDRKVSERGLTREPATPAIGSVIIYSTVDQDIPAGTVCYTEEGVRFLTDYLVSVTGGTATVTITAETPGLEGNVPANTIVNIEVLDATCNNDLPTTEGKNIESDESLIERYRVKVQAPSTSGNIYHYQEWAKAVKGVGDAKVVPTWNGPGTVKVIVIGTDKRAIPTELLNEVTTEIENNRPIGAIVTVQSGVEKVINISVTLELSAGYVLADVKAKLEEALVNYFKEMAFNEDQVKYTRIGTIILGISGVLDYSGLTINGGTQNIDLLAENVAVLGVVTV